MTKENLKAAIQMLINERTNAIRLKDIKRLMQDYAPDILSFDVVDPLQYPGIDAIKKRMEEWFSSFDGPIGYDIQNLQIIADNEVAFSYGLNHVNTTKTDGVKLEMWWRETICYRKEDDRWIILHQHSSVPFDVKTGNASLSLKP
jgi:uncharacterized protein (TIGR02246 family)